MSNLITAISALGFILCTLTARADSTPINVNTKRTVLVESFTVECTYTVEQTVCVEVVTSGSDKGKSRTHVGPGSAMALDSFDMSTDGLDPIAGL